MRRQNATEVYSEAVGHKQDRSPTMSVQRLQMLEAAHMEFALDCCRRCPGQETEIGIASACH